MSKKTPGLDPELVRQLAQILNENGLTELEVEHGELKLRLTRALAPPPVHAMIAAPAQTHVPAALPAPPPQLEGPTDMRTHAGAVLSPMVGTAYLSPEPGATPFIKVGDTVTEGQTLMVVEAMKTFNPIPATRAGKVKQILVTDAQPVEFGEALLILE